MIKVGITGSLASGKSTATKILSAVKGPFFSADAVVKKLYTKNKFKKIIIKNFNLKNSLNIKKLLKEKIIEDKSNIKKLEKIIHPLVRKEMQRFIKKNKKKNLFSSKSLILLKTILPIFLTLFFILKQKNL